ncbi:MAG: PHP domain-containing protein [Candidatus Omnitrophica bacterium]|nr:PHP domain-containing protein [Candidatus Omnitrophota bacterium]
MISKNKEFADLHIHTDYSDGLFSPKTVVQRALELKLGAIAITDHDNIAGVQRAIEAARGTDLEIIPGIEISAADGDKEIHILGYFIDHTNIDLVESLGEMRRERIKRMERILALLSEKNISIPEDKVFGVKKENTVGRLHLARVMVEEKVVKHTKEAFDRYIGDKSSCCVKHKHLDYKDAVKMITSARGVAVLAHPGATKVDERIGDYVKAGVAGLEVYHSKHRNAEILRYQTIAEQYGLLVTGGSDCHGKPRGRILMGEVRVSREIVEKLRAASGRF